MMDRLAQVLRRKSKTMPTTQPVLKDTAQKHQEALRKADKLLLDPRLQAFIDDYRKQDAKLRRRTP